MKKKQSRVLVVDDMPINRVVLLSLLATHGVLADQAESGMECLSLCEENAYDLILLDHRMPDMDGVDTLVRLKELFQEKGREIPVICHTTDEGRQNVNLYKAAGFRDVLIKPIDPGELFNVLMMYLPDEEEAEEEDPFEAAADQPEYSPFTEESAMEEIEKLPMWLKVVPHIDLVQGITNCGSAEDYLDALYIFYSSIEEKAGEFEQFLSAEDWTMYALRIHSLKSMARLIGARKLGEDAVFLEEASRAERINDVRMRTTAFLQSYRRFAETLAPIAGEMDQAPVKPSQNTKPEDPQKEEAPDLSHSVLFIQGGEGIVTKGIDNHLSAAGFRVISIPDEPDRIIAHRKSADLIVYYPNANEQSHIGIAMSLLGEICQDDNKLLCLVGDTADLETAMASNGAHRVSRTYQRPVTIDQFVRDMQLFSDLERDFHRRKTIFVVDDDHGYLSVLEHWLQASYNVSCFQNGEDVLAGLSTITPDLILLDYEMPEMDGCELMKRIRTEFPDTKIPIIFLTGTNDRELVFHVLESKPEGYLLKTSQKEALLDALHRFYAETLFRMSL